MKSLCLLLGLLFLTPKATAENKEEYGGLSFQKEEMEPEREMKEEEDGKAVQLMLNEDGPQDFLLASLTQGQNRKLTFRRCLCRRNCPITKRNGRCPRNAYICCSA